MPLTPPTVQPEAASETRLLGGAVRLLQPDRGYRAGMDAVLLAAAVDAAAGERWIEAGCGAGGALLSAAARRTGARFLGLERDPAMLELAARNIALNSAQDRCEARLFDVQGRFRDLNLERFDGAFVNPPYFDDPLKIRGPMPEKTPAFIAEGGLSVFTRFVLSAVRDGGRIVVIHRAERLGDLLALLGEKAGSFEIRPVQPFHDAPAGRVIIRARRGGRAPLRLLAPLVMHERAPGGPPTDTIEAAAVLGGRAALGWGQGPLLHPIG